MECGSRRIIVRLQCKHKRTKAARQGPQPLEEQLLIVNRQEKPQQQTQGCQARMDLITKRDKIPSCPLCWGNIHLLPQPSQLELFAAASTNYQLIQVFSLCILHPYFSLKCLLSPTASIYTGDTIRAFTS